MEKGWVVLGLDLDLISLSFRLELDLVLNLLRLFDSNSANPGLGLHNSGLEYSPADSFLF